MLYCCVLLSHFTIVITSNSDVMYYTERVLYWESWECWCNLCCWVDRNSERTVHLVFWDEVISPNLWGEEIKGTWPRQQETTVIRILGSTRLKTHWDGKLGPSSAKHRSRQGKELDSVYRSTLNNCDDDLRNCGISSSQLEFIASSQ